MRSLRVAFPVPAIAVALAASLLLLLVVADRASAYAKPPGGGWRYEDVFDRTDGGSFALSRDGSKIAKLTLVPGQYSTTACGSGPIKLLSRPQVKSYRNVSGRYAVGKIRAGLFVPIGVSYKRGGRAVAGKLLVLWDESGRIAESGKVEIGACSLSFHARKGG
jgi:hypothetical protein